MVGRQSKQVAVASILTPSARMLAKRASAQASGIDGKIAIGFPFHDCRSMCCIARDAMIGLSLHAPAMPLRHPGIGPQAA